MRGSYFDGACAGMALRALGLGTAAVRDQRPRVSKGRQCPRRRAVCTHPRRCVHAYARRQYTTCACTRMRGASSFAQALRCVWRARASSTATGRGPTGVPSMCRFGIRHAASVGLTPCSAPQAMLIQHATPRAMSYRMPRGMLHGRMQRTLSHWHRPGLSPLLHDAIYSSRSPSSPHQRARLCRACTHVHGCARAPIAWAACAFACTAHVSALSGSAGERSRRSERDAH